LSAKHILSIKVYLMHPEDLPSCQECGRQSASAASPSMNPLYGTVYRLLCATTAYHWTRSSGI